MGDNNIIADTTADIYFLSDIVPNPIDCPTNIENETENEIAELDTDNIFNDDILQFTKLNKSPTFTLIQDLDRIEGIDLENLDGTLDLCNSANQIQGNDEICILVTDDTHLPSSQLPNFLIRNSNIKVVKQNEHITSTSTNHNPNASDEDAGTTSPGSEVNVEIIKAAQTLTVGQKTLDDIKKQCNSLLPNVLEPICDEDGVITGYYVKDANGTLSKVTICRKDDAASTEDTVNEPSPSLTATSTSYSTTVIDGVKHYACPVPTCDKKYRNLTKYRLHLMTHTDEKPFKCMEPSCKWAFKTLAYLKRHMDCHKQKGHKNFVCDYPCCGNRFTTIYNLRTHKKMHENPYIHICPKENCKESFPTKLKLHRHAQTHTDLPRTYKCPDCDRTFYSKLCMGSHERIHRYTTDDLTCDFNNCGKMFKNVSLLKIHKRSHTGDRPFVCNIEGCNWAFTTSSKRTRHIFGNHTTMRLYTCTVPGCEKSFKRAEHLKLHIYKHTLQLPCTFEGCTATFNRRSNLTNHLKQHTYTTIYHCPIDGCQAVFKAKGNILTHLNKQHKHDGIFKDLSLMVGLEQIEGTASNLNDKVLLDLPESVTNTTLQLDDIDTTQSFIDNILPSHGITYTDSNTGAVYLHTQLLQDDPPHSEMFVSSVDTLEIHTTSTINLHDLK